ncbi:MAG TPA: response regulator [Clostridiaceae bacterium]|nr:response regulator [Clostridiaceae bacterium]
MAEEMEKMNRYSVLVVDDEHLAREHILNTVEWDKLNISTLFEASNGYDALDIIREHHPEIIVLDIKMPGINGVEVLALMQQEGLSAKVIISSGYSDFEAAQKMLSIGNVVEYILKPVNEDQIVEAVIKCIIKIDEERKISELNRTLKSAREIIRKRELFDLIFGQANDVTKSKYNHIEDYIQIAVARSQHGENEVVGFCKTLQTKYECLREIFIDSRLSFVVLYFSSHKKQGLDKVFTICQELNDNIDCKIGIGRVFSSLYDANLSYREATVAYDVGLLEDVPIMSFKNVRTKLNQTPIFNQIIEDLKQALINNRKEEIDRLISEITTSILNSYLNSEIPPTADRLSNLKVVFMHCLESVMPKQAINLNLNSLLGCINTDELYHTVKKILIQGCHYYSKKNISNKVELVNAAKKSIEENYADNISLNSVAADVMITPSYLSRLFTEIEGQTFSDYVLHVRMNKAKELLSDRSMKIYEIAEMVGYRGTKHFLKVFKEKEGLTPSQYRNNILLEN